MPNDTTRASLDLLFSISRELATTLDLRTVLGRVLSLSIENVRAERGTLIAIDEHRAVEDAIIVVQGQTIYPLPRQLQATLDQGLAGWVLHNHQPALVEDTSRDDRWLRRPDDDAAKTGPKSAICIPLTARDKQVGVLTIIHSKPGSFNPDHLALLQAIADQAGIAIHNASLYKSLQIANRRYRELFEDSIDPLLLTTLEGRIIEVNRQATRTTGFTRQQLTGRTVDDLHALNRALLGKNFKNLRGGKTISYQATLQTRSGSHLPVEVYVRRVQTEDAVYLQWMLRDISERKALDALHQDLASMIYHDLRSPISNVVSGLDVLAGIVPLDANPTVKSILSIANRSLERTQRMISSLLDISRLEAGQSITNREAVPTVELVQEAVEVIKHILESKEQQFTAHLLPGLPSVWVDADMARRVLVNLMENAAKFTPAGGSIAVGAEAQDDFVLFWVQDSGAGISKEAQEHIFDKYIRLRVENQPKGAGLGLAFCRLAVKAHGGKIWVESKEGKGSRFLLTFPVSKND